MSDISDDDFANNYGPTTPAPPPKKSRQRSNSVRPVAGPSTKPPSKQTAAKKSVSKAIEVEEVEEEVVFVESPSGKRRKTSEEPVEDGGKGKATKKAPARAKANANGATKAAPTKGKARADAPVKTNGASGDVKEEKDGVLEVDDDEPFDPPLQRAVRGGVKVPKPKGGMTAAAAARQARAEERFNREIEHLRAQLEQSREYAKEVAAQRDKLSSQLEDVFRIRNTDAEQALAEYKAHYEESMKRKESLIQELTSRLTDLQSPSKASKADHAYTLHFLTREAAEEEKVALKEENAHLQKTIKEQEQQNATLRDEVETLRMERDAEIERSKNLLARSQYPSGPGPSRRTEQEVKNAPVIRIYEDMTNVLITSVKMERSPEFPEVEEEVALCIYTYSYDDEIKFSLNFTLRNVFEKPEGHPPGEPLSRDQLVPKVRYQPRDLDKEDPDIVNRLNFFREAFMFARDQMTVFLKTLTDTVSNIFEGDDNSDAPPPPREVEVIVVD